MATSSNSFIGVFVVVPAFNEAQVIGSTLDGLLAYFEPRQIIVVDDASSDATSQAAKTKHVTVIRHPINRGQGAALATGIAAAKRLNADAMITFDADGQHDPADLPAMLQPIFDDEADVVLGSRFLGEAPNLPTARRWLLIAGIVFTRLTTRLPVTDTHNGLRVLSKAAAHDIDLRQDRMERASELLETIARQKLRVVEKPVTIRYSDYSLSKGQSNADTLRVAARLLLSKLLGS